jgi:hypothetical protein
MNSLKRAFVKLALVGTLAGGIMGMPLVVSATPNANTPNANSGNNSCLGFYFVGRPAREGTTPVETAAYMNDGVGATIQGRHAQCGTN